MRPRGVNDDPALPVTDFLALLTRQQVADLLGISLVTLWRWDQEGRLPALRLGPQTVRYRREDIDEFIAKGSRW